VYAALDSAFRAHPGDSGAARAERLVARDSIYAMARDSLRASVPARIQTIPASALANTRLDNAVLLGRRVYRTDLDQFDAVFDRCGGNLRRTVLQIIAIARANRRDPFGGLRSWLRAASA
jgi:predicted aminopeptidase